jgi:hypothetical protein
MTPIFTKTHKVRIIYKSGHVETLKGVKSFKVKYNAKGDLTEVTWEIVGKPRPLHVGINEIAAVYEL